MRSTFKVIFYLKRDKKQANGNVPLFCRITVDGGEVRFGMKKDVHPKLWDVKAGRAMRLLTPQRRAYTKFTATCRNGIAA
jgi:hypothetical protein